VGKNFQITVCCEDEEDYLVASEVLEQSGFSLMVDPFTVTEEDIHSVYISLADVIRSNKLGFVIV